MDAEFENALAKLEPRTIPWPDYLDLLRQREKLSRLAASQEERAEVAERELARYTQVAEKPWSFHKGTLRERLEWCRDQHAYHAEHPPSEPMGREDKQDFDRACVAWYAEMLDQLARLERELELVGPLLYPQ